MDNFGHHPLDHLIREGLETDQRVTADGYATTMVLLAIRKYRERDG